MILRSLSVLIGLLLGSYAWANSLDSPLKLCSEIEFLLQISSPEEFRQERDRLISKIEARFGTSLAKRFIESAQPLTTEAANATSNEFHFSGASKSLFWLRFTELASEYERENQLWSLSSISIALGLMFVILGFDQKQIMDWRAIVDHYVGKTPMADKVARRALTEWIEYLLHQKERATDRAIQTTFALNRTRLELNSVRRELVEMRVVSQDNPFDPTVSSVDSISADSLSVNAKITTSTHSAKESVTYPLSHHLTTSNEAELMPISSPASPVNHFSSLPLLQSTTPPAETFMVKDSYNTSGSTKADTLVPSDATEAGISLQSRSSVRRLLSESQISDPSQLLPYIPQHPDFETLSNLRQRKGGVLVEITPDVDELLWLAQSFGPEAVTRYYNSLIEFIDRCFIALPGDLSRENYSLYWYSRVINLKQEDIMTVIRGEMPHVQWVGGEGIISQVQIHVTLHPLSS